MKKKSAGIVLLIIGYCLISLAVFPSGFALVLFGPIDTASCYGDLSQYERREAELIDAERFSEGKTSSLTLNVPSAERPHI